MRACWNKGKSLRRNAGLLPSTDIPLGSLRAAAPTSSDGRFKDMLSRSATLLPPPSQHPRRLGSTVLDVAEVGTRIRFKHT